ncbi:MAG TPA: M23 family metallopeptidase [Terriglobia bacterium]|nr:M23 family metallopeptidase [Terriglobia bacterium]
MSTLHLIALLAATIAAQQGKAVRLAIPDEPGIEKVEIRWQEKTIPYTRAGKEWFTVLGLDLDLKAGSYTGELRITRNAKVELQTVKLDVKAVKFPEEHLKVAEKYVELNPADSERAAREARQIDEIHKTISGEALWKQPFLAPIPGGVGSGFGKRRVFNGEARNPHAGADLKATTGTPIRSTNRGRVVLAGDLFFTGNTVIVDHGLGIYTLYAHLSRIDVTKDSIVERAQVVGLAGATGRVTGPHLHWGARVQNTRVDPFSLINLGK